MMSAGETVALSGTSGFASFGNGGFADSGSAGNGGYLPHPFPSIHGRSFYNPSSLSLAPVEMVMKTKLTLARSSSPYPPSASSASSNGGGGGDGGYLLDGVVEMADSELMAKQREEDSDDKFSSDNQEGGRSGEDQDGDGDGDGDSRPSKKKRYHRHTLHQIQEMERFFKECPHPNEKQRQELGRELQLSTRQIKFWFQNKRTKMKVHHERNDNSVLRNENEKLKAENFALRDAVRNLACPSCGGPASIAEMSFDEQQLRIENVRLREEIERITAMASKYIGRHVQAGVGGALSAASPSGSASGLADPLPAGALPSLGCSSSELTSASMVSDLAAAAAASAPALPLSDVEKPLVVELAIASMEELLQLAQAGDPLWAMDPSNPSAEIIDQHVYVQKFQRGIGPAPPGVTPETSRHTGLVIMNSSSLVETFMDVNCWIEMFPSIVSRAQTLEVLSNGVAGSFDGAIHLMYAEFQVPSPLVPTREFYFLRYCKRVDRLWAIVDVSVDSLRGSFSPAQLMCRRPSGCLVQEMPSGYSKVTWVEHMEAPTSAVHGLYQPFVNSGMAFGARRWMCTLQRQCERIASVLANIAPRDMSVIPNPEGRRSMLKLAERMTNNFCGGVSASTAHTWVTLAGNGGADDVRVLIRKSVDDPGRPPGIVLSAATSLWLPVPPSKVFQFLRDARFRTEWDILSNTGVVEEMFHLAKGQDPGNCVSLLRVNPISANQSNMLILQECCTDESCSLVVYAPVDIAAMSTVLNGGDPESVALLPSGFAILPDGPLPSHDNNSNSNSNNNSNVMASTGSASSSSSAGSLLTVAFQILVDHVPTARLSLGSVATVNKLISNTVVRIKSALACESA